LSSICQIGIATFRDGQVVSEFSTLIDPEDYFDPMNIFIHGMLLRARVTAWQTLPQCWESSSSITMRSKMRKPPDWFCALPSMRAALILKHG
jgi:hypothetical protein